MLTVAENDNGDDVDQSWTFAERFASFLQSMNRDYFD